MSPNDIAFVKDTEIRESGTRGNVPGQPRRVQRRVVYANGRTEVYEYDARFPPPAGSENQPWGRLTGSEIDRDQAARWERESRQPTARQEAPPVYGSDQSGRYAYNPQTGNYDIQVTPPVADSTRAPAVQHQTDQFGNVWRYDPTGQRPPEIVGTNPEVRSQLAAREARERAQDQRAASADERGWATLLQQIDQQAAANMIAVAQFEQQADQQDWERGWKTEVDLPFRTVADERAAQTAEMGTAGTIGGYETGRFNAARGLASDRVKQLMDQLPYKASGKFLRQYAESSSPEYRGKPYPFTWDAFNIQPPDLEGARQQGMTEAYAALPTWESLMERTPPVARMSPEQVAAMRQKMLSSGAGALLEEIPYIHDSQLDEYLARYRR